ncbi:hypothetical protein PG996_008329 [Apiospora saccharicola]|uniref:F-box domain-containing protein n=1 Tax=Apiospora saccharicola TaxID=335842 RepID=A0ABR1UXL5_9PEZI
MSLFKLPLETRLKIYGYLSVKEGEIPILSSTSGSHWVQDQGLHPQLLLTNKRILQEAAPYFIPRTMPGSGQAIVASFLKMIGNRTSLIRRIALSLWTFERGLDRSNEATDLNELESMSIPGKIVLDIRVYVDEEDQDMEEAQISDEARMIGNGNHRRSEIDEMEKTALSYGWAVEVQRVKRRTWSTSDGQWILYTQEDADGYEEELLDEIWEREQEREQAFSPVILGRGLRMRRR